jgi:hypothetical protein
VLAAEHLLRLAGVDFRRQLVEPLREIVDDGFARLRPFDEDAQVVDALLERRAQIGVALERLAALQDLLCRGLILPEIRRGRLLL